MPGRRVQVLRRVGAMVEEPAFYDYLSGRRNLELLAAMSGGVEAARIDEVLDIVGLADRQHDKVGKYSHGMRQRLGLAQALLPRPELLVLDEPANGLDPKGLREVRELIRRLGEQEGVTVFLSSHLLPEVEQICSRVGVIFRGRLVAQGEVSAIREQLAGRAEIWVDRASDAATVLGAAGFTAELLDGPGRLVVQAPSGRLGEINALLVRQGFTVSALIPERQTLEDFYMSAEEAEGLADGPEA
jgi:ABC-2 type transport system ATP-binding protein